MSNKRRPYTPPSVESFRFLTLHEADKAEKDLNAIKAIDQVEQLTLQDLIETLGLEQQS